jgi:hypothetical protein
MFADSPAGTGMGALSAIPGADRNELARRGYPHGAEHS